METNEMHNQSDKVQVLNVSTNAITVILFIIFSIVKRTNVHSAFIYVLFVLFIVNALFSMYSMYCNNEGKMVDYKKHNIWIATRIIANLGFAALTYDLLA